MIWLLSFIPGGQVVGVLAKFAMVVVKAVVDAVTVALANPIVFLIVAAGFCFGLYEGVKWDAHKIDAANARTAALTKEWKDANEINQRDVAAALDARKAAEDRARQFEADAVAKKIADEIKRGAARAVVAQRVRDKPATPAASASGWSLPWFPVVSNKN